MIRYVALFLLITAYSCNNPFTKKTGNAKNETLITKQSFWKALEKEKHILSISDTKAILMKFFAPDTIILNVALWKPDPEAKFSMKISSDGYCYSKIDTIIQIQASENELQRYLILFSTMRHYDNGESSDCHACGANYGCATIVGDQVECFNRNFMTSAFDGSIADKIEVKKIGKDNYALDITTYYQGSGLYGFETLFDLETLSPIFNFENLNSTPSSIPVYSDGYARTDKKLVCISDKDNSEHDELKLVITDTDFSSIKNKLETHVSTCYLKWNYEDSQYEPIKH